MAINATPKSAMQEMAITENAIPSGKVRRRMIGLSLHGWENIMLVSLALARSIHESTVVLNV
jgi:hypothetical protein